MVRALFGHSVFKFNQEINSCCQEVISIYAHIKIEFSVLNFDFQKMILSHSTSIFCLRTPGSDFNLDSHKIEIQGTEFNFQFFFFFFFAMQNG